MTDRRSSGRHESRTRRAARAVLVVTAAVTVAAFTFVYRFNTLGGAYGGFDNDHFVPFAYAKQVQAGAQPLRDFAGLGLQGAWPSLTYEVSAAAQRRWGSTLRSEALVSVGGVALAAGLTVVAASIVAPVGWAVAATLVSVFVAPTLYNYPKVLVLAAACLAVALHARHGGRMPLAAAAVVTAVAFLFRHDLAVYVAVTVLLSCTLSAARGRRARDAGFYVAVTAILLLPSLVYVQRHEGLVRYILDGIDISRREAGRTELDSWPRFADAPAMRPVAFFDVEENGVAWLYGLSRLLPVAIVLVAWHRRGGSTPAGRTAVAVAGATAFSVPLLVRGNVAVRLGDVGPFLAVVLALVCHELSRTHQGAGSWLRAVRLGLLVVLVAATALSTRSVGVIRSQLRTAGFTSVPPEAPARFDEVWRLLETLPGALRSGAQEGPLLAARYLNDCTQPSDRIAMLTYEPEILPFADRRFAGGRLSILPNFALAEHQQRALVAWWAAERVPIALVEFEAFTDPSSPAAPTVRDHLLARYEAAGAIALTGERRLRVFLERDAPVVSRWGDGLPCLR